MREKEWGADMHLREYSDMKWRVVVYKLTRDTCRINTQAWRENMRVSFGV